MGSDEWVSQELLVAVVVIGVLVFSAFAYFHHEAQAVQNQMFALAHQRSAQSDGLLIVLGR